MAKVKYENMRSCWEFGEASECRRGLMCGMGYTEEEQKRPLIAVVNSWNEYNPGHVHLDKLAERVKQGVREAGGLPLEVMTTGICDGMVLKDPRYIEVPSRNSIADQVELTVDGNFFDGMVLLSSCDSVVPGHLMGAARLNIPAIMVTGGYMPLGTFRGKEVLHIHAQDKVGTAKAGKMDMDEYNGLIENSWGICGACTSMTTANSMCMIAEALGMTLPGAALAPATMRDILQYARYAGRKIMELVEKNITARKIITNESIRNAIKVCLAMAGSTNAVMHLTAIAYEAELGIKVLDEFDSLSDTTPQLARMNPSCKYSIVDFYKDGGVPRLMENLRSMLETDVMTVTAHTLAENIDSHKYLYPATGLVNHTLDDPFGYTGGVAVLRGNLAPDTGITKPGAFDKSLHHFKGEAICFDSEEAAEEAILAGKIHDGHVVVIRYEGPKGGPGMREMFKAMKYLYGRGLAKTTALITDGRFSGTNNGCFVGHISPEAAEGGPIAIVHDGDTIEIDVDNKQLNLLVPDEEIEARLKQWKRPEPKFKKGWLGLYCKLAASGSEGGVMKFDHL